MQSPGTKPRDLVYITKHGGRRLLGDGIFSLVVKEFRFGRWWLLGDRIFSLVVKEFRFGESGEGGRKEGGWVGGGGQFW